MADTSRTRAEVWDEWQEAVNLTAEELVDFLETAESRSVGVEGSGDESTAPVRAGGSCRS